MKPIRIPKSIYNNLINYCLERYPEQSRGIFATDLDSDKMNADEFYKLESNHKRFEKEQKNRFKSYGDYYDSSKGFVTDPLELHKIHSSIEASNQQMTGLFHVHIDFPAAPSRLDLETFESSFGAGSTDIWYSILSLLNKDKPEFRVFWIKNGLCQELPVEII